MAQIYNKWEAALNVPKYSLLVGMKLNFSKYSFLVVVFQCVPKALLLMCLINSFQPQGMCQALG